MRTDNTASNENSLAAGLDVTRMCRGPITEFFLHGQKGPHAADEAAILAGVFDCLAHNKAQAMAFRVFTPEPVRLHLLVHFRTAFEALSCPVTWICQPEGLFAVQVQATTQPVTPIAGADGSVVGCSVEEADLTLYPLSLRPTHTAAGRPEQAAEAFACIEAALKTVGLEFAHTVRTWLFTHDILDWYDQLNRARDGFFEQHGIFQTLVPASTGVGTANPAGAALAVEAMAVRANNDRVRIRPVASPLQCSALDYKSAFSRAVLVAAPDHRRLLVSGTASIEPGGKTAFAGDTDKQVDLSMRVAAALIGNAAMDWSDIVRGIIYFKDLRAFPVFDDWCRTAGVRIPHIKVQADICRDDLLFELEIDGLTA